MARSKALFERLKALGWQDMDEQIYNCENTKYIVKKQVRKQ